MFDDTLYHPNKPKANLYRGTHPWYNSVDKADPEASSMKHLFIVNPAAGQSDASVGILKELNGMEDLDYELHITSFPGDATSFVRDYLAKHSDALRVYACGGDGTLNEVVNGTVGYPQASIGCYPCGSGNDFVKYYGGKEAFLDLKALIRGREETIDLIRVNERYAINACHFGLDSAVASKVTRYKQLPLVNGRLAYLMGVAWSLFFAMRTACSLVFDGEAVHEGDLLLCTLANGTHVGGSYRCAPRSSNKDGLLELCIVKPLSRLSFLRLAGVYKAGRHLDDERLKRHILYRRGKVLQLSGGERFSVSLDGEVIGGQHFTICACKQALRFIVPENARGNA
jgi:diacylglycerol kinase (ATP)